MAKLSVAFASMAILIACLGLFGLASFTAEQTFVYKAEMGNWFYLWACLLIIFFILITVLRI